MVENVRIVGEGNGDGYIPAAVNEDDAALVISSITQQRIHLGELFYVESSDLALGIAGVLEFLVRTPSKSVSFSVEGATGGDGHFTFFEAPTTSADGSALSFLNRNRPSTKSADTLVFAGPTVTVDGTQLLDQFVPGGLGKKAGGQSGGTGDSFLLKPNTDYLLRFKNNSGAISGVYVHIDIHETN